MSEHVVRGVDERGWYFQYGEGTKWRFDPDDTESVEKALARARRQAELRRDDG